jgi:uncharacterized protein DUF4339
VGEEWIVRVEGKEYGPVETEELREWRREGRLIPANELRRVGDERWIQAGELPEVFGDAEPAAPPPPPRDFERTRTWRQILAETLQIYRRGFVPFMLFGLLTSVPMFVLQWTFPKIPLPDLRSGSPGAIQIPALPPISMAMLVLLVLVWPVSAAGFQFVADDILHGRTGSMGVQFSAALRCWVQMLGAALLVYGSYFFWFFVPLAAIIAFSSGGNALLASFMILLIGGFMVYMNARLFINFLFWQQTAALGAYPPLAALRESKELARSVPEAPRLERPLYRGAIVASVWLLLLLLLTFGVQLPFALARFIGVDNPEQAMALMRKMAESQTPDALMFAADIATAATNLLLRPLLAAAFVVLYYDAKARSGRMNDDKISLD